MTLSQKQREFTKHIGLLIQYAYEHGFELSFGEVARTIEQQQIYYNTGRSKTLNSRHLERLAADFNIWHKGSLLFIKPVDYAREVALCKPLGDYWESLHPDNVWGGDFNRNDNLLDNFRDPYHFERKP